jgi:hypothetical protein
VGDGLEARLFNCQFSIPSSNPTAAEFEVFESRTYIGIDPGAVGTIDPSDSLFVLVVEEKEGCLRGLEVSFSGRRRIQFLAVQGMVTKVGILIAYLGRDE